MKARTILPLSTILAFAHTATAQDILKENNTDALNTTTSWVGGSVPGTSNVAVWDATVTAANSTSLGGAQSWQGIRVADPGGLVTVNDGAATTLTLGTAGIDMSSSTQNLTLNVNTTVNASQSWNIASGRTLLRSGATTTFGTGTTTTLSGAGIVTLGGSNHILAGSGDLAINGASLYNDLQAGGSSAGRSGTTTLNSGIIRISTSLSLFGTGAINLNGGAIGSFSTTGRVIGSNDVNIGGNIQIGGSSPLSSGFIRFDGATDLGGATREINAIATSVNTNFGSGAIFTGVISNGGITKTGSGTLTLNNNTNTFTGATTINAGSLAISQSALLNSSSVTLATTGTQLFLGENGPGTHTLNNLSGVAGSSIRTDFTLSGANANRSLTVNQSVDGEFAGSFVQGGSRAFEIVKTGTASLTLSGAGGHTLGTTVSAGTLKIAGAGLLGAASYAGAITNNATLHFDSTATQTLTGTLTGSGTLLKSNTGSLTISGDASGFNGNTTVSGGILALDGTIGGNLSAAGGRLLLNSAISGNVSASSGGTFGGTGSSTGSLNMSDTSTLLLTGGATTTGLSFDGVTFGGTVYLEFASSPNDATVYDVVTYGAGGLTGLASLSPLARGTLTDDAANSKITFTAGAPGTRTWNSGDGVWDRFGTLANWAEGDQVYYQGDDVIFGDIASDTTITLEGLLAPFSVTVNNTANTYTFTGTGGLSGNGLFDKIEAGTLVIANPNPNFSGSTFIGGGILRFVDGGSWGSGEIINDATLEIQQSTNLTLSNAISGIGTLVKNGTGTLRLTGSNSFSGGTALNSGILQIGGNSALGTGTLTINGGIVSSDSGTTRTLANALAFGSNPSFGDGINAGQLAFDGPVDLQAANRTITSVLGGQGVRFNGVISNGGIIKAGTGRVTLANDANTFTGPTTINEGILGTSTGALATSSSVTIASGAELALGSNGTTLVNNLNGAAGSLIVSNFNITADGARTLEVNQTVDGEFAGSNTQGAARVISLIKSGAATLSLTGSSTYTGTTTVSAGTLRIGGAGTLGGGTYAGAIINESVIHFDSTATQTLSGLISGSGTLLKSNTGTLILTNNNDGNTGAITIDGGTLQIGNNTTAGFIGNSATVTNNSALVWFRSNDTNVGNAIAGTGTLTKLGTAALNLNGDSTHTGATTVAEGTLRVNGSLGNTAVTVEDGATLAGNGNIGGSVTIEAGATHRLAVAATPGSQVTRVIGGGLDLDADGDILALDAASAPAAGTYILATATGGITGSPETVNQTGVSGIFSIVGNNLVLTVGGNDYDDWAGPSGFNLTQGPTGDDDGDGLTNFDEYAFGLNPTSGSSVSPVTPPDKTAGTFTYTRRKPSLTGLSYTYHSSTTLSGTWPGFTPSAPDQSDNGDPVETITVTIPPALLAEPALFLRVEATQP